MDENRGRPMPRRPLVAPLVASDQEWTPIKPLSGGHEVWKKVLYVVFLVLCLGGCLYQIISLLTVYFSYPHVVSVSLEAADRLTLPGLTLCNSNSVTLSNLKNFTKHMDKSKVKDDKCANFETDYDSVNDTGGVEALKNKQQLIDDCLRILMSEPATELVNQGPSFEQFVVMEQFKCAFDKNAKNENETCRELAQPLTTSQSIGNCYTLFHGSRSIARENISEMSIAPGLGESAITYGNSSGSLRVEVSDQMFQPNEILRMQLNFRPDEYTSLLDPVFGTITLHDPTECPDTRKRRFYVYPGYYYEFYITKRVTKLLEAPFEADCYDYVKHNGHHYVKKPNSSAGQAHPYLDAPLSRDDCRIGCLAAKTMSEPKCKCWPPELPFFDDFEDRITENSSFATLTSCDWTEKATTEGFTDYDAAYFECLARHNKDCEESCRSDCEITSFDVEIQSFEWPDPNRIEGSNEKRKKELQALKRTNAVYWTVDQIMNVSTKKFQPIEFVSYVGGIISLYMGMSLLGLYDDLVDWIAAARKRFKARREKKKHVH